MATAEQHPAHIERRVVLEGVSWETYQSLRDTNGNHLRMTYDRGVLEIMSPSRKHGKVATLIGLMIYEWCRLRRIPLESGGDLTCDRQDLERGLEPDLCYWVTNQAVVRGKDDIDLAVDPPPDLALEVEVSRSAVPKLPIYQELRVPEVWRWRAEKLEVLRLQQRGNYATLSASSELPDFPLRLAEGFIEQRDLEDEITLMERFEQAIAKFRLP